MKSSVKKVFHPVGKEFRFAKCGFNHNPADDFVRSQWQKRTKCMIFLLYRWLVAIFFSIIFLVSLNNIWMNGRFFIYFTNWGLFMCAITNLFGGVLLLIWYFHPKYSEKLENFSYDKAMPISFKIYWALHTTTLSISLVISIIYWIFLYPLYIETIPINALNVFAHAFNSILMVSDIVIVAFPVRILHVICPVVFTFIYMIFSIIYYFAGGTDAAGNRYIYPILNWAKPGVASAICGLILILFFIISFSIFTIYKIRVVVHRHIYSETKAELPNHLPYFDRTISTIGNSTLQRNGYTPTTTL